MSNNDQIKANLSTVLKELREDYIRLKAANQSVNNITLMGQDCKEQLDRLKFAEELDITGYGCVSFGRNGLCYTCHTRPARADKFNCLECSGGEHKTVRTLEQIMESLRKGLTKHQEAIELATTVKDVEETFK